MLATYNNSGPSNIVPSTSVNPPLFLEITPEIWFKSNKFHITFDQPNFPYKYKVCQQSQKNFLAKLLNIVEKGA